MPGVHLGERVQVQEVLEHEQVVEQGVVSTGPLDLAEPEVLVLHRLNPGRLDGRQVLPDRVVRPGPRPHGHGVEQHSDDSGQALALPARDGHAEHRVGAAGVRAQQEAERTGQHRVQRDAVRLGRVPQQVRQLGGHRVHERARQLVRDGRLRSGEQGGAAEAVEVVRPEAFRHGGVLGGERAGVVLEARRERGRVQGFARDDGPVGVEQVPQQDLARPAVPQQEVVAQEQAVAAVGQTHHGQPDQRRLTRVESGVTVPGTQGVGLGVRRDGDRTDVDAAARLEDLDRIASVVGGEARAHDRVPGDHVRHRLGERVGVQPPVEGEVALCDVVSGRARQLGLEVQAPLEGVTGAVRSAVAEASAMRSSACRQCPVISSGMPSARVKAACRLPVVSSVQAFTSTAYGLFRSAPVMCGAWDSLPLPR